MCTDAHLPINDHSALVATTETSHVRLARNQEHPGYCLVILRAHITDMAELTPAALWAFWSDVQHAARAIDEVFQPKKLDYLVMGHRMPHLHCHLLPQHATDDPRRNVNIADGPTYLSTEAFGRSLAALASAWEPGVDAGESSISSPG
ncbi:MAG TPA: HIT family protein [Plantibacter sp.]|uniref:HIT family protein n=1 Tax=unclassified Plantibacter TaxID=2624265 RepID=UPI002B7C71FF|nr:HIT family protein [Plantibacter sp.]